MRKFILALLILLPLSAHAAAHDPAESNWIRVQAIAPGKTVTLKSNGHRTHCKFVSADADSMTCAGSKGQDVFQRTQVALVQSDHRAKSTLIGLGVGTGGGALIGAAIGRNGSFVPRGPAAIVLGAAGAIIGTLIGGAGNFAHTTIYRAP